MDAEAIKNEGNTFFKEGHYEKAIEKYTAPNANWGGNYLNFSCDDGTVTGG